MTGRMSSASGGGVTGFLILQADERAYLCSE